MLRLVLLLALAGFAAASFAEATYKWVDAQGVVHYSDKPVPGATKVQLPAAQTFKAPPPGSLPTLQQQPAAPKDYDSFIISSPAQDETLFNVTSVTVGVSVSPGLRPGDSIKIALDGQSKTGTASSATFDNLERGEHVATATIVMGSGKTLAAPPVKFTIRMPIAKHTI
jgi:Domain of unknown function (DUF4124)